MKILSLAAASSANAKMAGTHTVKWYPPTKYTEACSTKAQIAGLRRCETLYSFAAAKCVHMLRKWPVVITPQRPVGTFSSTRYSTRRPAVLHVSRRIEAYLSLPTQPIKRVEDGGRMY